MVLSQSINASHRICIHVGSIILHVETYVDVDSDRRLTCSAIEISDQWHCVKELTLVLGGGGGGVLGGVFSQCTRTSAKRKSNPEAARPWDLTYCSHKPEVGLNHDYNMAFSISLRRCKYSPFRVLLPLLDQVVPLNTRNCRLTMPVVKRRCARDALPHTSNTNGFKSFKKIYHKITHLQWNFKNDWRLLFCFSWQWLLEFLINSNRDWHWDTHSPSLHIWHWAYVA